MRNQEAMTWQSCCDLQADLTHRYHCSLSANWSSSVCLLQTQKSLSQSSIVHGTTEMWCMDLFDMDRRLDLTKSWPVQEIDYQNLQNLLYCSSISFYQIFTWSSRSSWWHYSSAQIAQTLCRDKQACCSCWCCCCGCCCLRSYFAEMLLQSICKIHDLKKAGVSCEQIMQECFVDWTMMHNDAHNFQWCTDIADIARHSCVATVAYLADQTMNTKQVQLLLRVCDIDIDAGLLHSTEKKYLIYYDTE